jgi:hypothetical protein
MTQLVRTLLATLRYASHSEQADLGDERVLRDKGDCTQVFYVARDGDDGSIVVIGVDSPHSHCSPWLNLLH